MPVPTRRHPLALALVLALSAAPALSPASPTGSGMHAAVAENMGTWIVRFAEPALASYAGGLRDLDGAALAPTSPMATGTVRLDANSAASVAYREALAERREDRLQRASRALGRGLEPVFVYDAVLNGVALRLTDAEAAALARQDGIAAVERERVDQLQDTAATTWIKAPEVWSGAAGVTSRGEGAVVGIIDTGINPTHPSFAAVSPTDGYAHANPRGRFFGLCALAQATCNNKLIGIWDFTTGSNDDEPNNGIDADGHGSHVAGSAAGNAVNMARSLGSGGSLSFQIRGAAPRANLISYKACEGEDSGCLGSWTLGALNQAVLDGVDAINYSIGGQNRSPWTDSNALAMLDARNAGIVVAVAAGNRGPDVSTVTSPSDAPWVVAVANSTHGRRFVNRLRLSGGGTPPPNGGVLEGDGLTGPVGPVPLVRDPAALLCSQGDGDTALPVTGASNPWFPGRWSGQIVVCDRGVQARVAKSNNVRLSGGGGMVLVNRAAEGESTVADAHSVPSTHIGFTAGQQLLQWLATGSGHSARIDGVVAEVNPANADILNPSSGRGPSSVLPGALKPDLAAPGTAIQSADWDSNGDATLSGTSMAAPHVAGAAALLRSANPSWRADQIISALMTTARPSVRREDGSTLASPSEQGAGMIDLSRAVRAGLALTVPAGQFSSAAGNASALNLPSLVFDNCAPACPPLQRTVTDLAGGGAWTVVFEAPAGVTLTASAQTLNLAAGQSLPLQIGARIDDPGLYGRWLDAALVLRRVGSDGRPDARLPIQMRAVASGLPGPQSRSLGSDRGYFDYLMPGTALALPDARFAGTVLVAPASTSYTLGVDPTPSIRYDNLSNGVGWQTITVPAPISGVPTRHRIEIELQSPPGTQASLLAGNGGSPGSRNQICESTSRCVLEIEHPGSGSARSYWAMVWNRSGSGSFTVTHSVLPLAPATAEAAGVLTVTGPGSAAVFQNSPVRVAWSDSSWSVGSVRHGAVLVYAGPGQQPMGAVPFTLTRDDPLPAPVLLSNGSERRVPLPGGGAHERAFIDVPAGTRSLEVTSSSAVSHRLFLAQRPAPAPLRAPPIIDLSPPRAEAQAASPAASLSNRLVIANPAPGRWYATPVNASTTGDTVLLRASIDASAPLVRAGGYFNPERPGSGLFLHPASGLLVGLWYTYLQDGTPTWYYIEGAAPGASGQWQATVFRSAWNGQRNSLTRIGEATATASAGDEFTFSYTLDGETGSEAYRSFGRGCPTVGGQTLDASSHWFDPLRAGTGYSAQLLAAPAYEFYAAFLYDGRGLPRFLVGESGAQPLPAGDFTLVQLEGACPLCGFPAAGPTRRTVGTMQRRFDAAVLSQLTVDASFAAPVTGTWRTTDRVEMLDAERRTQGCVP